MLGLVQRRISMLDQVAGLIVMPGGRTARAERHLRVGQRGSGVRQMQVSNRLYCLTRNIQRRMLIGTGIFRVLVGATILFQYLINYAQRRLLYGPEGIYPYDLFLQRELWSMYALSPAMWYFEICFHLGLAVTFAWTIGAVGRLGVSGG